MRSRPVPRWKCASVMLGTRSRKGSRSCSNRTRENGRCAWTLEEPAGVLVSWPDHRLDGTLASHVAEATEEVMARVVDLLDPAAEPDEADEPG